MTKIKIFNIIQICLNCIVLLFLIIYGIIKKFDSNHYSLASILLGVLGVLNIIFIFIKETSSLNYDSKKYDSVMYGFDTIFSVAAYYIHYYLGNYEAFAWAYWLGLIILNVVPIIVCERLSYKFKNKNQNGPRVIVNK